MNTVICTNFKVWLMFQWWAFFSSLTSVCIGIVYLECPADAATMISVELWRARIGTFNNKRCSGRSLSSSSFSASSHCRRHRGCGSADVSQEEPASIALTSSSSSCSSLAIKEQSQEFPSTDHHSVLTTSSLSCSSQCCGSGSFTASSLQSSSSFFPTSGILRSLSLLRDAVITLLIAIISQLLMIAGDIETNPGPKHGGQ